MARASRGTRYEKEKSPFATRLLLLMKGSPGVTQAQLAEITGKTRQTISQYVNGTSEPGYDTLVKIANHFRVSLDYLLGRTDVLSSDLSVQEIRRAIGLTEENIISLMNHGPFGQSEIPPFIQGYEKLTNDLLSYASTHQASRTYSRFIKAINSPDPPSPLPAKDHKHTIVEHKVVAEVLSGIPEDGVDYAQGYTAISAHEYSRYLLDDFMFDLKAYLQHLYFDSENEEDRDGID